MSAADLKAFRAQAGLTQTELAAELGLSMRAVQDLEAGKSPVRGIHLHALNWASMALAVAERNPDVATARAKDLARQLVMEMYPQLVGADWGPEATGSARGRS